MAVALLDHIPGVSTDRDFPLSILSQILDALSHPNPFRLPDTVLSFSNQKDSPRAYGSPLGLRHLCRRCVMVRLPVLDWGDISIRNF